MPKTCMIFCVGTQDKEGYGEAVVHMAGEVVGLSQYPRLLSILNSTDDLDPHLRSIGWVVRLMDELYDARQERGRGNSKS